MPRLAPAHSRAQARQRRRTTERKVQRRKSRAPRAELRLRRMTDAYETRQCDDATRELGPCACGSHATMAPPLSVSLLLRAAQWAGGGVGQSSTSHATPAAITPSSIHVARARAAPRPCNSSGGRVDAPSQTPRPVAHAGHWPAGGRLPPPTAMCLAGPTARVHAQSPPQSPP